MRSILAALLLSSLLIGLAHIAGLPAFEGVDETAHYSYIEQIAKIGTLPRTNDRIRQDAQSAEDILATVPDRKGFRYRNLFADAEIIERVRRIVKAPRDPPPTGEPGSYRNWEAQHPPLYYAVLTPGYLLSERWSLVAQLALLRGISYFAAWLSLCLAVFAAAKSFPMSGAGRTMIVAPALWPFVFPGWFPEMARLGNDSLVALLIACAVAVVACAPIKRWSTSLLLGIICGLGVLTKVTFLPFLAVIAVIQVRRTLQRHASPWQFLGFLATVLAVAGWWYFQRFLETGMLFATDEGLMLKQKGGLMAGLTEHFSVFVLARFLPATGLSFLWSGTSSFITPPLVAIVPLVAMSLLIGCAYLYGFRRYRRKVLIEITPLTLGFWVLAMIYPILVFIAMYGGGAFGWGGYAGYHLHSLAPGLAPIIGIAITTLARHRLGRTTFCLLLGYNVAFLYGATFLQFIHFAGCDSKDSARFNFASAGACLNDWQRLIENLDVVAYPLAALWLAVVAAVALGWCALASLTLANGYTRRQND